MTSFVNDDSAAVLVIVLYRSIKFFELASENHRCNKCLVFLFRVGTERTEGEAQGRHSHPGTGF